MDNRIDLRNGTLGDIATLVLQYPGLRAKAGLGLVTDVLGPTDWITGPGDDAAAIMQPATDQETFLLAAVEAIFPPFVRADPFEAGVGAVVANVNDIAAMGGRPAGIVDTIIAPEPVARRILEGLRSAAGRYGVPVVGGHLSIRDDADPSLSAFTFGHARRLLSTTSVADGQTLLLACCRDGKMREDFPFFSCFDERAERLAGDIGLLAGLAEAGHCLAAKDVSMAGLLGSLAMLLEPSGCGATVDLDKVPRPAGVPVTRWLQAFPLFSFLLCAPASEVPACREAFSERGLTCEAVGRIDGTGRLQVVAGTRGVPVLDLARDRVTGSGRPRARAPRAEAADWSMTYARGPSPDPAPLPGGQPTRPQALPALTVTELVRAIRDGSLSPADLVTEALTSRHRWPPVTTAASQIWPEELWRPRGRGQPTRTCHWRESRCW